MILPDSISTWQDVDASTWDVVVIGAGPAGSVTAAILAANGRRVLIVEKSSWPREKVCGGCLNAGAMRMLSTVGLADALASGIPIRRVIWQSQKQSLEIPAGGAALLRSDLDASLVSSAIEHGCAFLPGTAATLLPQNISTNYRLIQIKSAGESKTIQTKMVFACDGITGTSVDAEPWATWRVARRGWIGVSATLPETHSDCLEHVIHMRVGSGGYIGMVRLPGGSVHLAAALNPKKCRQTGGATRLIGIILRSCGLNEIPDFRGQHFRGTGVMSRHRERLGGHRVLSVGDACGYVEPFTGEGMAWAITSAVNAANLLLTTEGWTSDLPARWQNIHYQSIQKNQRWCRAFQPLVHQPSLAAFGMFAARTMPAIKTIISSRFGESNSTVPAQIGAFG